jgi:hypothetical protein
MIAGFPQWQSDQAKSDRALAHADAAIYNVHKEGKRSVTGNDLRYA